MQHQNRFFSIVVKFTWKIRNRLNRKKNQISDFYFSSYGHFCDVITPIFDEFCMGTYVYIRIKYNFFFKNRQIYMIDPESAESKEKSNSSFLFFDLWSFLYSNHPIFQWIFTIIIKIKIGKIGKLNFHSIQHIRHLSW